MTKPKADRDQKKAAGPETQGTAADTEVARIIAAGEPGVASAMLVLETTEKHYYAAVHQAGGASAPISYVASNTG
jgi:hypothetical protein